MKNTTDTLQVKNYNSLLRLKKLGWTSFFDDQIRASEDELYPARVIGVRKNSFIITRGSTPQLVSVSGALLYATDADYPAVGDWVLIRDSVICLVLSRVNALVRNASGVKKRKDIDVSRKDQFIATNLSKVFIVCGLDRDFNLRRIERYLSMVYNCGITPEIILTKADLHPHPDTFVDEINAVAFGVPITLVSADDKCCIDYLKSNIAEGETVALVGSSGAGKSTLINRLYGGDVQATSAVSTLLGKGRHTTTNRDLISLPSGGMVIDNPGIREVSSGSVSDDSESVFPEIDKLAENCRFSDCSHTQEPGCQVLKAVSDGIITPGRLQGFHKIQNENRYLMARQTKNASRIEKERFKGISQRIKQMKTHSNNR